MAGAAWPAMRRIAALAATASTADPTSGDVALWGADLTPYYNQTFAFGDAGGYPITTPANTLGGSA